MKEQLINFETAKLAKEKGFDVPCTRFSFRRDVIITDPLMRTYSDDPEFYERPTQSILQTWLREVHDIKVCVSWTEDKLYDSDEYVYEINHEQYAVGGYNTYEEALEDGLQKGFELL